jgi:NADPH2:quinone reductase
MRAVVLSELGGPEQLKYSESEQLPNLRDGEVLVKNAFAGINYVDIYHRTGVYPLGKLPTVIGQEAAGTIVATRGPNPLGLEVGDRVVWIGLGAYAEYTAVPFGQCVRIPPEIADEDATSILLMGMTALSLVRQAYAVQKGDVVLVHAAAGGVGLLLCQILSAMGATVIGTAGSREKCALAKKNGAAYTIDYNASSGPSWVEQVKEITKGEGVDVV